MRTVVTAAAATSLVALLLSLAPGDARGGWWDDLDKGQSVTLRDLIAKPDSYRGGPVTFFCVFHRRDEVFNPIATPYNPTRHANVAVWADGEPVWEQEAYRHDFPFLYIERRHPQHDALVNLDPFIRIEVTARIGAVLRSFPQIEVLSFRETSQRLGPVVVQSLMAGDRYAEAGDHELAYENWRRALTPDLPPGYDLLVRKRVAEGLRRLGREEEARAMDGGGIVARSGAPEPGEPSPQPPGEADLPGPPGPTAAPAALTEDLPGTPVREPPISADLPGAPAGPSPAPEPPPILTAGPPAPLSDDLPGQPSGAEEGAAGPPPVPRVPSPQLEPPPAARPAPPPGAPPRRSPRLSGVK